MGLLRDRRLMASRTKKPVAKTKSVKTHAKKPTKSTAKSKTSAKAKSPKPATKKTTRNSTVRKNSSKSGARKESLVTLRAHIDEIEARLAKADKATRSSVSALKASYTRLSKKSGTANAGQEGALTDQLDALSSHLTGLIDKTREDVAHDLQMVLDDPRMETVSTALTKANHRITTSEREQARSIGAINEQISTLAAIVDDRLQAETREREKLRQALSEKIDTVETRSATAVRTIGDKVVTLTEELNDRAQVRNEAIKQDLSEQNVQQQRDLDEHKSEIGRRIEAIEDDQRNTIPSLERRLVTLASRIEVLETDQYTQEQYAQYAAAPAFAPMPEMEPQAPQISPPANVDAFSPHQAVAMEAVMPPAELTQQPNLNPVGESVAYSAPESTTETHVPDEYVPQEYIPAAVEQQHYAAQQFDPQNYPAPNIDARIPDQNIPAQQITDPYANVPPPVAEQNYLASSSGGEVPPPPFMSETPQVFPHPEQTMDAARPGGHSPKEKRSLFSLIKGGGGNGGVGSSPVKLFALMTGIAVVGLFAAQKILPTADTKNDERQSQIAQSQSPTTVEMASNSVNPSATAETEPTPPVIESMDVVGDYSDTMQAPDLEPEAGGSPSPQQLTLEKAAGNGNKIAQFQMGLAHLEAGRNEEAVRLIRLSANQGQPAAQYRLAKLYENGIGVEKNLPTAMKLLQRSAKGGNRIAMHDLGHYYATATATEEPNIDQAVQWFQKAAERGVLDSQFNLGVLYQEGSGVPKSEIDAYVWYKVAGAQGDRMAEQRSELIARNLSEGDLDKAVSRAKAFTPARIDEAANGIFRELPWTTPAKAAANNSNSDVKTAQERLADLGYEVGTPDGAMGPKTRNAIIAFERANGLPETGRVSSELVDRLNLAAGV